MTSSDEERETLIAEAERYIRNWDGDYMQRGVDEVRRLAAALKAQRPVWEVQAEALEEAVAEVGSHYPIDMWAEPTDEQLLALHAFAKTIGIPDGSRFHVHGIRHALRNVQARAAELRRSAALIPPTSRTET